MTSTAKHLVKSSNLSPRPWNRILNHPLTLPANMSSDAPPSPPHDLSASGLTIPSDSERYSSLSPPSSSSPPQSSNHNREGSPVIIYQPPTVWSILRGAAINLLLPFVNGMMLGFGELLAHEFAFRLGWGGTNVSCMLSSTRSFITYAFCSDFAYSISLA